jgi:tRNA 2-selenouridine synthase
MKEAPIIRINVPKAERIKRLVNDYGRADRKLLAEAIQRITKRLGHEQAQLALDELEKGNLAQVAAITLAYYDKAYDYNHEKRQWKNVFMVDTEADDPGSNSALAIQKAASLSAQPA